MRISKIVGLLFLLVVGLLGLSSAQSVSLLHRFQEHGSVVFPLGPPVQGRDGELFGTTNFSGWGSVFREETSGNASQLYVFTQADAAGTPNTPVLLAGDGSWYGTTSSILYRITLSGEFTQLFNFSGLSMGYPSGSLIELNGLLYGMTVGSRSGPATVYTFDPASETLTTISQFGSSQFTGPAAALVLGSDGNLWGGGTGSNLCGAVFNMTTAGVLLNVYGFDCSMNMGYVNSPLVEGSDGSFYATSDGYSDVGAIFKVTPNGVVTKIHEFGSGSTDGLYGVGLSAGTDGNLYGTTPWGGNSDGGTIYRISTAGTYQQIYNFDYANGRVASGMIQHTDGKFYGFQEFTGNGAADGEFYSLDVGLGPFISVTAPQGSEPRHSAQILGQGLTGSTSVTFNGVPASSFEVLSDTYMTAIIPGGVATGPVVVTTPGGKLISNKNLLVP